MFRHTAVILLASFACANLHAQESKPAPRAAAVAPEAAPALSQSKFLGLLYAEIAKRTPANNTLGPGEVTASYHVNPKGKIDKVVVAKSTSPAHADMVRKILASVQAPPPPANGDPDIAQTFKFH